MSSKEASDFKFYMDYSRFNESTGNMESWDESVDRIMAMHKVKYADRMSSELDAYMDYAEKLYKEKRILGSMRALQFGGEPTLRHEARIYNCLSSYCDRIQFFQECMYWLLCGCGTGFSVQTQHDS